MVLNEILYLIQQPPVYMTGEAPVLKTTAVPLPEPFPMFMILFIGLIAWVILIRITRIRSMIIIMGGSLTVISISLIMGWVSNFIGISMIILCTRE